MHIQATQIRVGSKVIIRGEFGGGKCQTVLVEDIDREDGKWFVYYTDPSDGEFKWAYIEQVMQIVSY